MGEARRREGRPELVRARRRRGMSQESAAEAVGVSATTWARWERGEQGVRARYRVRMAAVFQVAAGEVERWIDGWAFGETSSWPPVDCGGGSVASTVKAADHLWRFEMDPSRRHLLATLPFVPTAMGEWLSAWAYDAAPVSAAQSGSGSAVGLADVKRVNDARMAFSQMDHQFGAGLVRPVVIRYLNGVVSPLLRGRYDDRVGAELMTAAAGMSRLAGWTAFDMSHHGQAQCYFGQALRLAKAGDDSLTGAWILTALTRQAIHTDQPAWALRLARAAVDAAHQGQASPRVMAAMKIREAWATALSAGHGQIATGHSAKQVQLLLTEADHAYGRGPVDRDPPWIGLQEVAERDAEAGRCWSLLGEHRRAADYAEAAVREFEQRMPRSAQFNRMHAAEAYLGMGELEQALDVARPAIPMARALNSARSLDFLRDFSGKLEPYAKTVAVREFRDHLRQELAA